MTPFSQLKTVGLKDDLTKVMALMAGGDLNQIPVIDGKLMCGLVYRADILRYIQVRQELGASGAHRSEPGELAGRAQP